MPFIYILFPSGNDSSEAYTKTNLEYKLMRTSRLQDKMTSLWRLVTQTARRKGLLIYYRRGTHINLKPSGMDQWREVGSTSELEKGKNTSAECILSPTTEGKLIRQMPLFEERE